jgi:hypothetical protein
MGGLARRVSYIKAFKHRSKLEVPTIFVDAGNLFSDEKFSAEQLPADVMTKNRWVVKGYNEFRHTAANVSFNDLPYVGMLLKKEGFEERVKESPFIRRLVSANVHPADDTRLAPTPYVVREITLKRGAIDKKLRIGIVGFTMPRPMSGDNVAGYRIENPFEAAKRVIPELKKKADVIVALAYMPLVEAQKLATENADIDTIIGAHKSTTMDEPQHFGRATISYAYDQTKYLGEMRYYVKGDGSVENQVNRYVGLDDYIPDDREAQTIVTDAHTEFTNDQNKSAHSGPAPPPPPPSSRFVGAETCQACHLEEYETWSHSGHSHAMATLEAKGQQFDNNCVKCHVVGFNTGGFQSMLSTPALANVQCESCHGPGRDHAAAPAKGYGFMQTPVGCVQCHTQDNSPDFDFATYWPKVKH